VGTSSAQSSAAAETLLNRLSYSHLELIVDQDDELKRDFYATECIRGNWSVRELKRQIASFYYGRTALSWYRSNVMAPDGNPPIGILLCAAKDHALVEYALAGIDNQLFVSKYQLHLPDPEQLRRELGRSLKREEVP
jgi:hypothetical protein